MHHAIRYLVMQNNTPAHTYMLYIMLDLCVAYMLCLKDVYLHRA